MALHRGHESQDSEEVVLIRPRSMKSVTQKYNGSRLEKRASTTAVRRCGWDVFTVDTAGRNVAMATTKWLFLYT